MKQSIQSKIELYLKEKDGWVSGGLIEDMIRQTDGHKASNASRRCRELEDEGIIERRLVKLQDVPNMVVQYRIKRQRDTFQVPRVPGKIHEVTDYSCDCDSFRYRKTCSHIDALKKTFEPKQLSLV